MTVVFQGLTSDMDKYGSIELLYTVADRTNTEKPRRSSLERQVDGYRAAHH